MLGPDKTANSLSPRTSSISSLILLSVFCSIPFITLIKPACEFLSVSIFFINAPRKNLDGMANMIRFASSHTKRISVPSWILAGTLMPGKNFLFSLCAFMSSILSLNAPHKDTSKPFCFKRSARLVPQPPSPRTVIFIEFSLT